jgi:predicted nucleic acid-binding protein
MAQEGVDALYSYDRDFDRLAGLRRIEPQTAARIR